MPRERSLYQERITRDPEIMVGKPVVRGTRIPVALVLAHLADNPDLEDLFAAYPRLTLDEVKACLTYAQRLVEEIDSYHDPENLLRFMEDHEH